MIWNRSAACAKLRAPQQRLAIESIALAPGQLLGEQYQIIKQLGAGGMGHVLLANDLTLDRFVAIKVLRPELSTLLDRDARIRREARLLSRLNHPHVVVLYAFGSASPQIHYIVMEYVPGETLEERLTRQGRIEPSVVHHVMGQLGNAVAEAHRNGIIHRDLKPANVLLTPMAGDENFVKIVDFGIAKMLRSEGVHTLANVTLEEGVMGTPAYMAPEQIRSMHVDGRADVYALGVMACELVTGLRPYDESGGVAKLLAAHVNSDPTLPSQLRPDMGLRRGLGLDAVIARALAREPADRYQHVEQFVHDLLQEIDAGNSAPRSVSRSASPKQVEPRHDRSETLATDAPSRHYATASPTVALPSGDTIGAVTLQREPEPRVLRNATVVHLDLLRDAHPGMIELDEYLDCLALVGARLHRVFQHHRGVPLGPLADRALVVFRPERAAEDDAERAIDAALAACSALSALSGDPTIPTSFQIAFRIGIDTGRIVTAQSGGGTAVVHGAPLFESRRLAHAAWAGQVRISNAVYRRVRGLYETQAAGDIAGDSPGRCVLSKKSTAYLRPSEIHGVRIGLIGRDREMAQLREALRGAVETRRPRVLSVTGPPGIGKSRLIADFIKELEDRGDERYFFEMGRCTPAWQGLPYEPFIQSIRHRARVLDDDAPEQVLTKLEHYIRRFLVADPTRFGEPEERLGRVFAMLFGIHEDDSPQELVEVSGDEPRRKLMFDAVASLCRRLASRFPLVFLIEDFEWATAPTKALLSHVLAWMGDCPALFVLVTRSEADIAPDLSFFRDRSLLTQLPLGPLDREAGDALARHMLRELIEVPGWLLRRMGGLAEGVPLILEETVHDLIDNGVIVVAEGRWRLAASAGTNVRLPDNLEQLFLGRIERLDPCLRLAVDAAAVAGRRFWPSLLGELIPDGGFDPWVMGELVARGMFVERRDINLQGEFDYGFAQAASQEVVYRNIPRARRRALHKAAALWLERCTRGTGALHEDTIGHHFREAGELARALPYGRRAAERAIRTHAIEEAVRLLQSCKEILTQIPAAELGPEARQKQLTTIVASLVHQLVLSGDLQQAVALADEVRPTVDKPDRETPREMARISIWKGWALEHLGRYAEARAAFVEAERLLAGEKSPLALMALTGEMGATVHLGEQGDCAERLRRTIAEHEAAPASQEWERGLSSAHRVLANGELHVDRYDASEAEYRAAYDLALSANAPVEAVDALNGLAAIYYFRGQMDRAESTWRMALEQAEQWDLVQHRSVVLSNLGELELARGDTTKARATLQHAEALHLYLGSDRGLAETHRALSECHLLLGELAEARKHAERGLELAERIRSPYMLGTAHRTAAKVRHAIWKTGAGAEALAAVSRHLDASVEGFEAAGMKKLSEETTALRASLLG